MAERRMFAKTIVLSDAFLDMPMSARNLYFTLGMVADDDGFVNNPRSIMRQCGATDGDMKTLLANKFLLLFESGVIVIKHWRINNYLRSDRYTETKYLDEKTSLSTDGRGVYHINKDGIPPGIPSDDQRYTQVRLGKGRIEVGEDSTGKNNIPSASTERKEEEGESEGERTVLSVSLSPDEKIERIAHWRKMLGYYRNHGYETSGIYAIARAEGLSQEEIDGEAAP